MCPVALKSYLSHKPLVMTYLKIKRDFTTDKARTSPQALARFQQDLKGVCSGIVSCAH